MSKTETQSEALQLAEKIERHGSILSWEVARLRNEIAAELRRLDAENKQLNVALDEWMEKTHWVQETAQALEPGMHRADVLRARIEALDAENKALRIKAARYDYIKEFGTSGETKTLTHPRQVVYASIGFHGHELGAAIDARIAEKAAAKTGDAA